MLGVVSDTRKSEKCSIMMNIGLLELRGDNTLEIARQGLE